jgi:heme/copper-type cytochrome/quinol oxidase subunit 3
LSDAFTFSAFLIAYACLRLGHKWWPNPNDVFNAMPFMGHHKIPMGFVSIMTFILIMSSVFVVRAVQEGHRMNKKGVMYWMFWGILGGAAFLGCQAWEWQHLIAEGMRPFYNVFYEGKMVQPHSGMYTNKENLYFRQVQLLLVLCFLVSQVFTVSTFLQVFA